MEKQIQVDGKKLFQAVSNTRDKIAAELAQARSEIEYMQALFGEQLEKIDALEKENADLKKRLTQSKGKLKPGDPVFEITETGAT